MTEKHGSFTWYELMTTDSNGGEKFYRDVVGWGAERAPSTQMEYILLKAGERPVAGLMAYPPSAGGGAHPTWLGDIYVDDVDKTAAKVKELGGQIKHGPDDIPNVGRFAVATDPHGATFVLLKWSIPMGNGGAAPGTPGYTGWRELYAGNLDEAFAFYSKLFGWTKSEAMDMGPMGTYQLFAHAGETIGGMMNKPAEAPAPCWNYYFNVDSAKAAVERVKRAGGQIVHGPMQVPGGSWIVQGLDPQHASFALVSQAA
jgi:uncharacterized protein